MRLVACVLLALLPLWPSVPADATDGPRAAVGAPAPDRAGAWPLSPRPPIASGFAPPASAWGAGHRGVDLVGQRGQRVRSALAGTVTFASRLAGRGVVVVDHGGVRTTYEPVSASVRVGQRVGRGAPIGTLQRFSSHCFPRACLHWGMLRGSTYLDPLTLVGGGPVRLLPLDTTPTAGSGVGGGFLAAALRVRLAGARAGRPGAADPR